MPKFRIAVCKGPACRKGGSDAVFSAVTEALAANALSGRCEAYRGGCYGLCHLGPNVVVRVDAGRARDFLSQEDFQLMGWPGEVHYAEMTPAKAVRVVIEHVGSGTAIEELRSKSGPLEPPLHGKERASS